jgi:hypothetical protein
MLDWHWKQWFKSLLNHGWANASLHPLECRKRTLCSRWTNWDGHSNSINATESWIHINQTIIWVTQEWKSFRERWNFFLRLFFSFLATAVALLIIWRAWDFVVVLIIIIRTIVVLAVIIVIVALVVFALIIIIFLLADSWTVEFLKRTSKIEQFVSTSKRIYIVRFTKSVKARLEIMCGFEILHKLWETASSKQRKSLEQGLVFLKPILQLI